MTKEDFQNLWSLNYPETVPILDLIKHKYSDRWFRIHSSPESKRYPDNEKEWAILLTRQNEIITDLFGYETPIVIITVEYNWGDNIQIRVRDDEEIFNSYSFVRLDYIQMNIIDAEKYDESDIYRPAFANTVWKPNYHDKLLREIANDNTRALFVSFNKKIIIAPYDGGVDFIVKDNPIRDTCKEKYKQWLSKRKDGL